MTAPLQDRPFWTVGHVAELLACAPRTVSRWVDENQLRGNRLPGCNHRRIARADLDEFVRRHYGRSLDELLENARPAVDGPRDVG